MMRHACIRLAGIAALAVACACTPEPRTRPVPGGPLAPVRVVTDRWGIPHVFASNRRDLYRAWGWVTARDRMWQLALTRAQGRGDAHRWLGNDALRADGGAQLFRIAERADSLWARDRADTSLAHALEAYAAGINDWMAECRAGRQPRPPELAALGWDPAPWRPEDSYVLLLGFGITLDLDLPELGEADALERRGEAGLRADRAYEGQWIYDSMPDSAARARWGESVLEPAGALAPAAARTSAAPALGQARALLRALRPGLESEDARASNAFAIGAGRSASGAPVLANDPHLPLTTPGPFHAVHLHVPGDVEAIGAAVPGLPAIVSGRNRAAAWGVTALSADVCDVFADTLSADGRRARGPTGWSPVVERPFALSFRVLGVPLPALGQVRRYTAHGPVLEWDRKRRVAYSLRWSAFEDARITLRGIVGMERSAGTAELLARVRTLVTPTLNLVAADTTGHVAWQANGLVPRRVGEPHYGPRPSDGRHEWAGFIAPDSMPSWSAPRNGYVVNANNRPVGPAYPYAWPRFDWAHDRAFRIAERLGRLRAATAADVAAVQADTWSRAGARWLPRLLAAADAYRGSWSPRARTALDTLRAWDADVATDRAAPTLFRSWLGALLRRTRTELRPGLLFATLDGRHVPDAADSSLADPPAAVAGALEAALDTLRARLGGEPADWRWSRVNRVRFRHALAGREPRGAGSWEPERVATGGDRSSPAVSGARLPWSFDVTHGPVFRHVVDLAVADSSRGLVAPWNGARADDDVRRWAEHELVPFLLDSSRVEAAAAGAVVLRR